VLRFAFLIPPVVAFLLLAAHFYRAGIHLAVAVAVAMIVLVFVRRPWAARIIQLALVLAGIEWLRSAVTLVHARGAMGEPYLRLALILGGVALFTALAALVVQTRRAREHFGMTA
jgi:hypothetical protein